MGVSQLTLHHEVLVHHQYHICTYNGTVFFFAAGYYDTVTHSRYPVKTRGNRTTILPLYSHANYPPPLHLMKD